MSLRAPAGHAVLRFEFLGLPFLLLLAVFAARAEDLPWLLEPTSELSDTGSGSWESRQASKAPTAGMRPVPSGSAGRWVGDPDPTEWRAGTRWRLPLSDGGFEVVQVRRATLGSDGLPLVWGHLEGSAGSEACWAVREGRLAGWVRRGDGSRRVLAPVAGGGQRILDWSSQESVTCGNREGGAVVAEGGGVGDIRRRWTTMSAGAPAGVEVNTLDLLMVYTPAALEGAGGESGMAALMELTVAEANDAFQRSEVGVRLRIVGRAEVDYVESGDLTLDLTRLSRGDDGWMDSVPVWRQAHAADVVCLVTEHEDSNQYAGMANQLRGLDAAALDRGYTVCLRPYLLGNYTLAHEVGHLLGANHDRETNPEGGLRPGSYGMRFTADGQVYRTVMAYRPGIQIPHFSNPLVRYRGVPTGVAGVADNAGTMNWVAPRLSEVREPEGRIGFVSASSEVREADGVAVIRWSAQGMGSAGEVRFRTRDATARAGVDFEALDVRLPVEKGGGEATVTLTLRKTSAADGVRQFWLVIDSAPSGWGIGPGASIPVTILDDDSGPPALVDTSFKPGAGADHVVRALAVAADDAVYLGGSFGAYDGVTRPRLVRVLKDGGIDTGFSAKVKYQVNAVVPLGDGRVAIAGDFNTVNDVRMNHVAVLKDDGSLDSGFGFEVGTDLSVRSMALAAGGRLVLGGAFTTVQGVPALRVARLMPHGGVDSTFDARAAADGDVEALALDGDGRVWLGGRFGRVGGQPRGRVARLESSGRLDAGFGLGAGADGPVLALVLDGQGRAIVAGEFRRFDGRPVGRVARLTTSGRVDVAFRADAGDGADDTIQAVCLGGDGSLWVAGRFTHFDGVPRRRVARLRADGRLDGSFDPGWGPNDWVMAVGERSDGGVVLGGVFTEVMGVRRSGVAVLFPEIPGPARMTWAGMGPEGYRWRAWGWPRQTYAVERTTGFGYWHREAVVRADSGTLEGVLEVGRERAGFVRLRRIVE